jgi:ribosomal protein S24E
MIELKKQIKNPLLKREELEFDIISDSGAPSFSLVKKEIAEELKKKADLIEVLSIKGSFGSNKFRVITHVYDKKEELDKRLKRKMTTKQRNEETKKVEEEKKAAKESKEKSEEASE